MNEDYFEYLLPKKKFERRTKQKQKIKRKGKKNALILRTFIYEGLNGGVKMSVVG